MGKTVLSLDLATHLGWCVGDHETGKPLSGHHKLPVTGDDIGEFIDAYDRWLVPMLVTHQPAIVTFENPIVQGQGQTTLSTTLKLVGLVVHTEDCAVARRLQHKDSERFIGVEWAEETVRPFEIGVLVIMQNGKGVLARVAAALASAKADIVHVDMDDERAQDATDLRFIVSVRDRAHLESVLRNLKRTAAVMRAQRITPGTH